MNRAWQRVASLPSRSRRRPVANGSSVPAWPVFCLRSRRTRATMSCDVTPASLSTSRTPGSGASAVTPRTLRGTQLRLDLGAEDVKELVVREVCGEARGTVMPSAAVLLSDRGDVDPPGRRPQAHLAGKCSPVGLVADHRR